MLTVSAIREGRGMGVFSCAMAESYSSSSSVGSCSYFHWYVSSLSVCV